MKSTDSRSTVAATARKVVLNFGCMQVHQCTSPDPPQDGSQGCCSPTSVGMVVSALTRGRISELPRNAKRRGFLKEITFIGPTVVGIVRAAIEYKAFFVRSAFKSFSDYPDYMVGPIKTITQRNPCLSHTFWTITATSLLSY